MSGRSVVALRVSWPSAFLHLRANMTYDLVQTLGGAQAGRSCANDQDIDITSRQSQSEPHWTFHGDGVEATHMSAPMIEA